jgi:hypothetical protein
VSSQIPAVSEVFIQFHQLYPVGFTEGEFIAAAGIEVI